MRTHGYNVVWWIKHERSLVDRVVCNMTYPEELTDEQRYARKVFASDWRRRMDVHPDIPLYYPRKELEKILLVDCSQVSHGGTSSELFHVEHIVRYWLWLRCKLKGGKNRSRKLSAFYQYCNLGVGTYNRKIIADLAVEGLYRALR